MQARGYEAEFAERCFSQIEGFGEYGFPESHAASFALLVYVSAWIKCFYPDVFCAALINSQPMGFYQPAQLVRDAKEHGVEFRPPDVNASDWDCTLEPAALHPGQADRPLPQRAVRLGLRLVAGLAEEATRETLLARRGDGYTDIPSLWRRSGAPAGLLEQLADADAFRSLGLDRREALWAIRGLEGGTLQSGPKRSGQSRAPIFTQAEETGDLFQEAGVALPKTTLGEHVVEDYSALGLSLKAHPVSFFRDTMRRQGIITAAEHWNERLAGRRATVAGLVLVRQRPGTAKGVIFLTLEDETGVVNVVVWPKMFERYRRIVMGAHLLVVRGKIERHGLVIHVIAESLTDLTPQLARLASSNEALAHAPKDVREGSWNTTWANKSRDFH
jgi:DNA polymerase III alpha subunit